LAVPLTIPLIFSSLSVEPPVVVSDPSSVIVSPEVEPPVVDSVELPEEVSVELPVVVVDPPVVVVVPSSCSVTVSPSVVPAVVVDPAVVVEPEEDSWVVSD
jgi:hypothetical protein